MSKLGLLTDSLSFNLTDLFSDDPKHMMSDCGGTMQRDHAYCLAIS